MILKFLCTSYSQTHPKFFKNGEKNYFFPEKWSFLANLGFLQNSQYLTAANKKKSGYIHHWKGLIPLYHICEFDLLPHSYEF